MPRPKNPSTRARHRVAVLAACGLLALGCMTSHGVLQTAHTTPPKTLQARSGAARVGNSMDDEGGRGLYTNTTVEAGARLGVTDFMDVGVQPLLGGGAAADAKANVFDNRLPWALAPRLSFGYAASPDTRAYVAEAGWIASYRFFDRLEPYGALGFANHWLSQESSLGAGDVPPDQQLAERRGYGDGLVKATGGLGLRLGAGFALLGEYAHWFVAQNDPGDDYAFLSSDILAVALEFRTPGGSLSNQAPGLEGEEISRLSR